MQRSTSPAHHCPVSSVPTTFRYQQIYAANFATASVGTNITIFVVVLNLIGADSTNYIVAPPTGLKADILSGNAPLTLSITTTNGNAYLRGVGGPGETYVIQSLPARGTGTWSDLSGAR